CGRRRRVTASAQVGAPDGARPRLCTPGGPGWARRSRGCGRGLTVAGPSRAAAAPSPACAGRVPTSSTGCAQPRSPTGTPWRGAGVTKVNGVPRRTGISTGCGRQVGPPVPARSARGGLADDAGEVGDLVVERAPLAHELADLALGVHDRGVVAAAE